MTKTLRRVARMIGVVACLAALALAWAWRPTRLQTGPGVSALVSPPAEETQVCAARIEAKNKVADELLDGRLTLVEAAACFRHLNDNPPGQPSDFRRDYPGGSDGEKACRQVIVWVHARALHRHSQSQADLAARRLEGELEQLLARGATVELPW